MKKVTLEKSDEAFVAKLIKYCIQLKKLKPRDRCIFNVIANYGSYQISIGPELDPEACKKMQIKIHSRPVEINGYMHHLFVNPNQVSALPDHNAIKTNLRGSVIMKDISIHIVDEEGIGKRVKIERIDRDGVQAKRRINLAGPIGDQLIEKMKSTGRLANDAYKIIQEDIIKSLKIHR